MARGDSRPTELNEWMFNDTSAQNENRLLGVRQMVSAERIGKKVFKWYIYTIIIVYIMLLKIKNKN